MLEQKNEALLVLDRICKADKFWPKPNQNYIFQLNKNI